MRKCQSCKTYTSTSTSNPSEYTCIIYYAAMAGLSNLNAIVGSDPTLLIKPTFFNGGKLHKQTPTNLQMNSHMKAEEFQEQYQTQLQTNSNQTTTRRFLFGLAAAVAMSVQSRIETSLAEDNGFLYTGPIPIPPRDSMRYELVNEIEVQASASSIWNVYSSKDLPKLIVKLLPEVFQQIDYISGDGGVGTVVHVVFPLGSVPPQSYSEMFKTIDHVNRVKEVQQVSGGYLAMGVTYYMDRFEIVSTSPNSCIIISTTEYEVPDHLAAEMAKKISVDGLVTMANAIIKYVQEFAEN